MSYCVDANVFITAWYERYPKRTFPTLYRELKSKLPSQIILIKPIFDEIEPIENHKLAILDKIASNEDEEKEQKKLLENHPVRIWLKKEMRIKETPIDGKVEMLALELEGKYETDEVSKGASPQDIKLIAFASLGNHSVVTFESEQKEPPSKKSNYKIPLICKEEKVECISFVEMLNRCDIIV